MALEKRVPKKHREKIVVIFSNYHTLTDLSKNDELDRLKGLGEGARLIIPDMVRAEATMDQRNKYAGDFLEWIYDNSRTQRVEIGNTNVFDDFMLLLPSKPYASPVGRGELSAIELAQQYLNDEIYSVILVYNPDKRSKHDFFALTEKNLQVMSLTHLLEMADRMTLKFTSYANEYKDDVKVVG